MIDVKKIESLARQVHNAMPISFRDLGYDIEKKIRQILQSQLTQLNLVNRTEFDVHEQSLLLIQEKITELEERLIILEKKIL
ncbi:accessory factor UbiK family protein [Candidatus Erwinia haradaeae]|uniref:Ubiquinone biosynthesis accessory factor UbiK n=1 Tax=Candidatus Erwinia haradaeae TaxID=1922217 RepID=A0A451D225_9GAMM|nr:accessory factor UbiK family protein [Candidatus Erwinia haradaeae]VFP79687.1 ubiquinone biosynthesis accessory factor UbiK [Candidatus Erwinia haradaeae]